jgi:RNA polymerase sigma-70 factor (ECF subfamily)
MIMTEPARRKAIKEPERNEPPAPLPVPVEEELVNRARQGDLAAYDDLIRRYQERVYATIYHMTSNHEDANDLAQEAFIKAFHALKSFKGGSSFYTWVYRIAVNKTINFLKQRKNKAQISLDDIDFNAEHDPDLVAGGQSAGIAGKIERCHAEVVRTS